jgi:predicted nucleotidyltransferase
LIHEAVPFPRHELEAFCQRWKIHELALFGSVLRGDFDANSDIDLLVSFSEDAKWSLFDHVQMEIDLSRLFNRDVDLVSKRAVEKSSNWIRRREILESAETVCSLAEVRQ